MVKNILLAIVVALAVGEFLIIEKIDEISEPDDTQWCTWDRGNHILKIDASNHKLVREAHWRTGEVSREGCQ